MARCSDALVLLNGQAGNVCLAPCYAAKKMENIHANSALDAAVRDEKSLKMSAQQQESAHLVEPSPQHLHQRNIGRVLPSLGGDALEQTNEMVQEQQDGDGDGDRLVDNDDDDGPADHDDDDGVADDDVTDTDDDNTDTDDDDDDDSIDDDDVADVADEADEADNDGSLPTQEAQPVVESVSLKKRKPVDETKEPYLSEDSDNVPCGANYSISTIVRCKTSALIRFGFGVSIIVAFFYYRRRRRLGGRRRRMDKSHEYARIIQEYDDLEGTFGDDISYDDDNETMSTWSDGGVGGMEMQNYHTDDRLGMHELNG